MVDKKALDCFVGLTPSSRNDGLCSSSRANAAGEAKQFFTACARKKELDRVVPLASLGVLAMTTVKVAARVRAY